MDNDYDSKSIRLAEIVRMKQINNEMKNNILEMEIYLANAHARLLKTMSDGLDDMIKKLEQPK